MKFRKKPVVIDAVQWTGENHREMFNFLGSEDADYVLRLCVCLPLVQSSNLPQMLMGQIAQNRCYKLAADY